MTNEVTINRLVDNVAEKVASLPDDAWVYVVRHHESALAGDADDNTVTVIAATPDRKFVFCDSRNAGICIERSKAQVIEYIEGYLT